MSQSPSHQAESSTPSGPRVLAYAARGWPAIPLHTPADQVDTTTGEIVPRCDCRKSGCPSPAKHPRTRNGLKDASTDPSEIEHWWRLWPQANVGVLTGPESGLLVLDVDPDKGGDQALADLEHEYSPLSATVEALTGGGGRHIYFAHPGGPIRNSAGKLGPGLDIRADGGYAVAPPSRHMSGMSYRWRGDHGPEDLPLAEMPSWLLALLTTMPERSNGRTQQGGDGCIPEGQRNATLASLAGSMRHPGMSQAAIEAALLIENTERCDPPLDEDEVRLIAASIAKYQPGEGGLCSFARLLAKEVGENAPPAFPDVLPHPAGWYVGECAEALGVPPEMVAVPLLAFAGAAMGNHQRVELKPGFSQRPNIYVAVVAPPGSVKTPAVAAARYPLDVLQKEAFERFRDQLEEHEARLVDWEARPKKERGDKPERPLLEHFFTTDATLEALAPILGGSPGLALYHDELVGWVKACDAYRGGRGGDRQHYLGLWAGEPLKVDRKGADSLYVPFPTLCVVGGVQPDLLTELADEAGRRDGFVERILWTYPETGPAAWSEEVVSDQARAAIVELFRKLRQASASEHPVRLGVEAKKRWCLWYDENAVLTGYAPGLAAGVYAKLPNQVARLALILHVLLHPEDSSAHPIHLETIDGAIALGEYFRAHAHKVIPHFSGPTGGTGIPGRVLRVLGESDGAWVPKRALFERLGGHVKAAQLSQALQSLAADELAERQEVRTDGRPSEQWRATSPTPLASKRINEQSPQDATGDDGGAS